MAEAVSDTTSIKNRNFKYRDSEYRNSEYRDSKYGKRRWLVALLAFAMVMAACTDPADDDNGDGGDGGGGDPDVLAVSNCREVDLPTHTESPRIFGEYIVFDNLDADSVPEAVNFINGTVVDLADIVIDERYVLPDGDGLRENYIETLQGSPYWQAVNERVTVASVTGEVDKVLLDLQEQFPDLTVSPIHRVGFMSHWGAFPGTDPQVCDLDGKAPAIEGGPSVTVGVVDTGIVNPGTAEDGTLPPNLKLDTAYADCDVSHGEFVSNVIRGANPSATVFASNAFPTDSGLCWESGEDQVIAATALVLLDADGALDVINFSLGAEAHLVTDDQGNTTAFEPVLTRVGYEVLRENFDGLGIYAAAGNAPPISPIYPAAYDDVAGVQASDAVNEPIVWDNKTPLPGTQLDWANFSAPGCDIVAVGTDISAAPSEVVVWSGSSFASPIAASQRRTASVDYDEFLGVLYADGSSIPSQCVKS